MITFEEAFEKTKKAVFEEAMATTTLGVPDLSGLNLIPYMVWRDINMGPARRVVFMKACEVTDMLVGEAGNTIYVPTLGRDEFTAQTINESDLSNNGLTKTKISPSSVEIAVGDMVYNATKISDILLEDQPNLGWVRASLQKMGESVQYRIESDIESALFTGAVAGANVQGAATAGVLSYVDIVGVKTLMSIDSFYDTGEPFYLFINPEEEGDLHIELRPTAGTSWAREASAVQAGQPIGKFFPIIANCQPLVTEVMRDHFALVVIPPTHPYGPAAIFAWKRHLKTESWRDEQYQRDVWALSTRYGVKAKETQGIGLISNC